MFPFLSSSSFAKIFVRALEGFQNLSIAMSSRHMAFRFFSHQDDREKINDIYREVADAHLRFQVFYIKWR